MAEIKPLDKIASKWAEVTPQRAGEYQEGIKNPRRSWQQATEEASDAYEEGVTAAISNQSFQKGVSEAGDAKWREGALEKGVRRWPEGVRLGKDDYRQGFAPFHSVIAGVTLPPRGPKGDPRNYDRVRAIGEALHEEKTGS
ncbi:hypothetical protein LCGC14_2663500 [marine sediment metagenome]|uniref:Uncharacterized protein n=1 Tax=marine sediment metagenome TaxID=412755 RepID=A0A0F9C1H1_9ZZZZ